MRIILYVLSYHVLVLAENMGCCCQVRCSPVCRGTMESSALLAPVAGASPPAYLATVHPAQESPGGMGYTWSPYYHVGTTTQRSYHPRGWSNLVASMSVHDKHTHPAKQTLPMYIALAGVHVHVQLCVGCSSPELGLERQLAWSKSCVFLLNAAKLCVVP